MRKILSILLFFFIIYADNISFAQSTIEVTNEENLPPPMVVTYDSQPHVIEVVITVPQTPAPAFYQPIKETTTMPPFTPTPAPTASPAPAPTANTDDIAGDYVKGTVYGPHLSAKELLEVKAAVAKVIAACIRDGMTEAQKIVALVNYVYDHCSYAPDWSKNRANTAWSALVYGEAQCSGYARAMKALCDAAGVGCYYVHASKDAWNPSHQWNVVCCDGEWYHLDVQMIDSSYSGTRKPIVLMGEHLPVGTEGIPETSGNSLKLQ